MKYFFCLWICSIWTFSCFGQGGIPTTFFEGKSIVLFSNDPGAQPFLEWRAAADSIHPYLKAAGADPVAYYELEKVALAEETQQVYAQAFNQRNVKNIILVTRQKNGTSIHISPYTGNSQIIEAGSLFGVQGATLQVAGTTIRKQGEAVKTKNLLVLDVAEFPILAGQARAAAQSASKFLAKNPLNLDVFKLGVPLSSVSNVTQRLTAFRYDYLGKSQERILAEQSSEKEQLKTILEANYPHEFVFLTEPKTDQELIKEKIQFLLIKVDGREADLTQSMGLGNNSNDPNKLVVKYYIRLIVRDELYIGPEWDASENWEVALREFLQNLKK